MCGSVSSEIQDPRAPKLGIFQLGLICCRTFCKGPGTGLDLNQQTATWGKLGRMSQSCPGEAWSPGPGADCALWKGRTTGRRFWRHSSRTAQSVFRSENAGSGWDELLSTRCQDSAEGKQRGRLHYLKNTIRGEEGLW